MKQKLTRLQKFYEFLQDNKTRNNSDCRTSQSDYFFRILQDVKRLVSFKIINCL